MDSVNRRKCKRDQLEIGNTVLLGPSEGFLMMTLLMTVTPYSHLVDFQTA